MKRLLTAWCALVLLLVPVCARAQFTDPHSYDAAPVGLNQLEVGYAFVRGNVAVDPSLVIAGAHVNLSQGLIDYTRYFGLFHRVMWVEAALPVADLSGSIDGLNIGRSNAGAGDSSYAMSMLVLGGPAMSVAQFADYKRTTTLGVSVAVTAPTGEYSADKLLNLGSDRWSFKPEIALSHPFGPDQRWQLDTYANLYLYTDNTSYRGREVLRQDPLAGLEEHISYSFSDNLWASFDTRYAFRGTTFVNGVDQNNGQEAVLVGSEVSVSLTDRHALLLAVAKSVVHQNSPAVVGFSVKYDYTWGKGL